MIPSPRSFSLTCSSGCNGTAGLLPARVKSSRPPHTPASLNPTALNNRGGSSGFTYSMLSRAGLLERGGERYRRHHGHGLPLLRLLADVDGVSGKGFVRRAEAVEHVGPLVFCVVLLHDTAFFFSPSPRRAANNSVCGSSWSIVETRRVEQTI